MSDTVIIGDGGRYYRVGREHVKDWRRHAVPLGTEMQVDAFNDFLSFLADKHKEGKGVTSVPVQEFMGLCSEFLTREERTVAPGRAELVEMLGLCRVALNECGNTRIPSLGCTSYDIAARLRKVLDREGLN